MGDEGRWQARGRNGTHHVCVVTETYPPEINGVALTVARLVDGLRTRGHVVSVVRPQQGALDRMAPRDSTLTLVRGVPLPGYEILRMGWPATRVLRRQWAHHRPHVIYVATEGPLGWSAVSTARRLNIPVFTGFHTNFHTYMKHYGAGWLGWPTARYLRWLHNHTAGTFVPSAALCEHLRAQGFRNLHVLERGVDTTLFTPERRSETLRCSWGASPADLVVLSVGRLASEKNVALAVEAYRAMQSVAGVRRFVLVGDGPLGPALRSAHPDLVYCGVQRGERLATHYASADLFLFASETETFGNVTLEAMASGLAVVAYDYAAARRHITDGDTGVLVPYGQAAAFIEGAERLARSPSALAAIRAQAREAVLAFDWPPVVERFEELLTGSSHREEVLHVGH
jgi:glycosyltransferase involved in cell wall biosynthesis